MTSEQPEQWLVNDATGGGWTVSQHTEEHYIEFVLYDRREADELALMLAERDALAQKLAAAEAKAALADEVAQYMNEKKFLDHPMNWTSWIVRHDAAGSHE